MNDPTLYEDIARIAGRIEREADRLRYGVAIADDVGVETARRASYAAAMLTIAEELLFNVVPSR